jgi:large subunit ribosomal protein L18
MKDKNKQKKQHAIRRQRRTRSNINGTATKPRVSVFRSLSHISVQAIDDVKAVTLVAASDKEIKATKKTKTELATLVGEAFGKKLADKKIKEIIFDKGSYKYHGRIKALADGIRKQGIKF